ncbi:MAG: ribosome recycling factor [Fimbriimonadaceae bacterium]|nr:ribosome recycling factor [Fimbriimonadaceae bacterium]QYK59672.1 MAG: ribosome recycling factor [Fimbriimonadaceae bacterium]
MTVQEIVKDAEQRMKHAVEVTAHDFQRIRTGRANPIMLEKVVVDYYGTETPVNQVANISVPEPRQLLINPYEKSMLGAIEKAIIKSDLGVNPNNDGTCIRLNFPQMTEDRRKELIKQVHHRAEEGCVAVRNVRRDALHHLTAAQKNKEISEDDLKGLEKKIQELTDKFVNEVHEVQKKKDHELMEI